MKNKHIGLILKLVALLGFLTPALYLTYSSYTFLSKAESVDAIIADERIYYSTPGAGSRASGRKESVPIAIYHVEGDTFKVEKMWVLFEEFNLGDSVTVRFEADNPQNARVDTAGESYGLASLLFLIFLILFAVGRMIAADPDATSAPKTER